jgi:putative membrane protein
MKSLLRNFLINLITLIIVTKILPGLVILGGMRGYILSAIALMILNVAIIPLLKVMFLPLNILTLGLFTWAINVIGLYVLTALFPQIKLVPFEYSGWDLGWVIIPPYDLNILMVAVLSSLLLGFIAHFLHWLSKS